VSSNDTVQATAQCSYPDVTVLLKRLGRLLEIAKDEMVAPYVVLKAPQGGFQKDVTISILTGHLPRKWQKFPLLHHSDILGREDHDNTAVTVYKQ